MIGIGYAVFLQAEKALDDGRSETRSISDARAELLALKAEVQEAQARLSSTQVRLDETVTQLTKMKKEAVKMAELNVLSSKQLADAARLSTHPEAAELLRLEAATSAAAITSVSPSGPAAVPEQAVSRDPVSPKQRKSLPPAKGLESSLSLEPGLKNFW